MKKGENIRILWHNPPGSDSAILRKTLSDGREYSREINPSSHLTVFEAARVLNVAVDYIYILIKRNKLAPQHYRGKIYFKMKDLLDYKKNKRAPGRPRKEEAFLI